ncbi:caspase domain-containing protein [Armillaria borealis]|uniref:Caspase domain-containing protein n=1 Tax=Armillaria borealis TaxID=47425 RepID=A0AA39M5G3_9AGAR|nr:caspase domain-containing protein [Armillaria borealis]
MSKFNTRLRHSNDLFACARPEEYICAYQDCVSTINHLNLLPSQSHYTLLPNSYNMGQVFSAVRWILSAIANNQQTTPAVAGGDTPVSRQTSEPNVNPSEQPPSNPNSNPTAESRAPQARQVSIGGGTPAQGKHQTFALVIGINEYKFIEPTNNLHGAVEDANAFENYLVKDLLVPKANIINLRDEKATRSAIIDGFEELQRNSKIIPREVAIIIYFAGHGAVAEKPQTWTDWVTPGNKVEMLCPADINQVINGKDKVEGIPDRTLSQLLLDLSNAKGNNITLILDCCHAAGQNRGVQGMRSRALTLENLMLSPTCDEHIYSDASQTRSVQEDKSGFSDFYGSHVLLAACKRNQKAWETDKKGVFTDALLSCLRPSSRDQPSYNSLMQNLKMPENLNQHAHWDGKHIRRRLFDCWQEPASNSMILCRKGVSGIFSSSQSGITLHAGLLHGIRAGSTFEISESDLPTDPDLKNPLLVVTDVKASVSLLGLTSRNSTVFNPDSEQSFWYARLVQERSDSPLNIHYNNEDSEVLNQIFTNSSEAILIPPKVIARVTNTDDAHLCLTVEENTVIFHRGQRFRKLSSRFPPLPQFHLSYKADIRDLISRYAHFNSHLALTSLVPITEFVTIKMIKLPNASGTSSEVVLENGGRIETIVDTSSSPDHYGFTVHNRSDVGLYIYILYFDASESTIDVWYSAQMGQHEDSVNPCIGSGQDFTFGHGRRHRRPIAFSVPKGQDVDVCFIKILVTTKAVDIGPITSDPSPTDPTSRGGSLQPAPEVDVEWASANFTVESKRARSGEVLLNADTLGDLERSSKA